MQSRIKNYRWNSATLERAASKPAMENESIKSEHSGRSRRSRNHNNNNSNTSNIGGVSGSVNNGYHRDRSRHSHRSGHNKSGGKQREMAPFQTSVNITGKNKIFSFILAQNVQLANNKVTQDIF